MMVESNSGWEVNHENITGAINSFTDRWLWLVCRIFKTPVLVTVTPLEQQILQVVCDKWTTPIDRLYLGRSKAWVTHINHYRNLTRYSSIIHNLIGNLYNSNQLGCIINGVILTVRQHDQEQCHIPTAIKLYPSRLNT